MIKQLLQRQAGVTVFICISCISVAIASPTKLASPTPPIIAHAPALTTPALFINNNTVFPVPDALQPAVLFWYKLFTEHKSDRVIIHDRRNLAVIWHVLELPKDESGTVLFNDSQDLIENTLQKLRTRLKRLASNQKPIDIEDRVILTLAGNNSENLHGAFLKLRTQKGVADRFKEGYAYAIKWHHEIVNILHEEGVPVEVVALPFVESMYNPKACSHAGAAGLWQLMPATARDLGLVVNKNKDERYDVFKATRAAARMLKDNYRMLGSWPLAITAYNYGPYGLKRAIKRIGSRDLMTLIEAYKNDAWGFAAKNFYAEFLAVLQAINNYPSLEINTAYINNSQPVFSEPRFLAQDG
ncbi:MAG: lytic transglycosylase domain-containing protein [Deltaproteobacteria bacterium]|nr:lytic transglycosylase domain-containing protein [Deltaproteobacteria bacterium]